MHQSIPVTVNSVYKEAQMKIEHFVFFFDGQTDETNVVTP